MTSHRDPPHDRWRTAAFIVGALGLTILLWLYSKAAPSLGEFICFVLPVVPAIAAYFAFASAKAAEQNLRDQRARRAAEVRPFLTVEVPDDPLWEMWWDGRTQGGVSHRHRAKTAALMWPEVSLRNFGGGPAVRVKVTFELLDGLPQLTTEGLSRVWTPPSSQTGITVTKSAITFRGQDRQVGHVYSFSDVFPCRPNGGVELSHVPANGEATKIEIPRAIMNYIFARSAQAVDMSWTSNFRVSVAYATRDRDYLKENFDLFVIGYNVFRDGLRNGEPPPPILKVHLTLHREVP